MEDGAVGPGGGASPEVLALAKVVARLRAEAEELEAASAMTAVLERAKGVVMAQRGVSADQAYEILQERAALHRYTLMEECWLVLAGSGRATTVAREPGESREPPADAAPSPFRADRYVALARSGLNRRTGLARVAVELAGTRTPNEVAQLVRDALNDAEHVDAVMIYDRGAAGGLDLTGHAGIEGSLAEQWSHVPPIDGVAALDALAEERPVWLEDPAHDAERYLLIGDPPGQWPSRAWIPVLSEHPATTVIGFFRTHPGPFTEETRRLLRRTARMCGESLSTHGASPDLPAATGGGNRTVAAIQPVLDVLPCPAVLLTPLRAPDGTVEDFRIDAAAAESVDVAGRRGKELVGRSVLETYPTVAGSDLWHGYLDTLTTGVLYEGDPFTYVETRAGVPRESVYSVRASRLGGGLVVSWIRHDADEREARRLADLQRLGNLGWAGWHLATDRITWSDQVYTVFGRDPALGPVRLEELPGLLLPEDLPALGAAVQRLLADGEPVDQPFRITSPDGTRHLRLVAEAEPDADGTPVEVHGFFQDLTAQRGAEIALGESERANLLQRGMLRAERALATRLRESLLPVPEQNLELAGLCVDVAYLPSDTVSSVGGDWYSAIELPDGCALFVVGDVAGHGLPAVGTMAQLRFTAKGMAVTGSRLPAVLNRLNALLLHTGTEAGGATATMVMARYQPDGRRLSWVRAGHLPPLLIRGGEAQFLSQPEGCLLGASFDAAYGEAVIDLLPGDHLLLYTDGLVEDPGEDIDEGLARFADAALRLVLDGDDESLARALAAARARHDDDICLLDVHVPDGS
ncbi:SpoIIE family protein phosphatase [Streptomyces sp. NPDC090077]|uniref:SpoIIE family protein phosphatase n=1 Tax=Streptomyces sp. NPDC090077 TaxID=3365938 RepID=UPI0037F86DEF